MFFFSTTQATVVILLLGLLISTPTQARRPPCAARCTNNKTKVFKQSADGKTCQEICVDGNLKKKRKKKMNMKGNVFNRPSRHVVPKGYVCGSCPVMDATRYNIQLELSMLPSNVRDSFTKAAQRWETVVKGDIPDSNMDGLQNVSVYPQYVPLVVDDLFITSGLSQIDGPLGLASLSGFEWVRADSKLPVIGFIMIKKDDLQKVIDTGALYEFALQEMGYNMGLIDSGLFQAKGLMDPSTCQYAVQSYASREWQKLTGCTNSIPMQLENVTQGKSCVTYFWNRNCLWDALMGGIPTRGGGKKLTRMTIGALQDFGYTVDYDAADVFTREMVNATCLSTCGPTSRRLRNIPSSSKTNIPKDRKLTNDGDEARKNAIAYGEKFLAENAVKAASFVGLGEQNGLIYVGHERVLVVYDEGNGIMGSVTVTNGMTGSL